MQGYLTRPKGAGPFPAVVLLPTCLGLPEGRAWRRRGGSSSWGYVALFVDDFATRGLKDTCASTSRKASPTPLAQSLSSGQPLVDKTRVAAVGFSQGGDTALKIAASPGAAGAPAFGRGGGLLSPVRQRSGRPARHPHSHPRRRQGRSDPGRRLRRADERERLAPSGSSSIPARPMASTIPNSAPAGESWE